MNVKALKIIFVGLIIILTCGGVLFITFFVSNGHYYATDGNNHLVTVDRLNAYGFLNIPTAPYTAAQTPSQPTTEVVTTTDTTTLTTNTPTTTKTTALPPYTATNAHSSTLVTITDKVSRPSRERVAILVPYRDRQEHLSIFIIEIERFLRKQNLTFHIFIIEQSSNGAFNRAKLFNVGFNESRAISNFSCYIFHDVDMLPMSPDNHYHCEDSPIHMAVGIEKFGFKLPYDSYAGGVLAMTGEQFQRINGFSNLYYGWGGEDDDIALRIRSAGLQLIRPSIDVGRYKSLAHKQAEESPQRWNLLDNANSRIATDGINSLTYTLLSRTIEGTKVHIIADVGSSEISTAFLTIFVLCLSKPLCTPCLFCNEVKQKLVAQTKKSINAQNSIL